MTPLMYVAWIGDDFVDLIPLLLKNNANPNLKDAQDNSILHYIAQSSAIEIYKLIKNTQGYDLKLDDRNK